MGSYGQETDRQRRPNAVDIHVGGRIRMRRMLLGISQEKLGNLLGLTFQQIQKYEKGVNRIGASRLFELAAILGVTVQYFFVDAPEREAGDVAAPEPKTSENADGEIAAGFLGSRESIELNRAFMSISKPEVRRSIIALVRSMADDKD